MKTVNFIESVGMFGTYRVKEVVLNEKMMYCVGDVQVYTANAVAKLIGDIYNADSIESYCYNGEYFYHHYCMVYVYEEGEVHPVKCFKGYGTDKEAAFVSAVRQALDHIHM